VVEMSEEIKKLKERIEKGEFRFGETLILQMKLKQIDTEKSKELLKRQGLSDASLYAYVASLEQRIKTLEELVEMLLKYVR